MRRVLVPAILACLAVPTAASAATGTAGPPAPARSAPSAAPAPPAAAPSRAAASSPSAVPSAPTVAPGAPRPIPARVVLRWGRPHRAAGRIVGIEGGRGRVRGRVAGFTAGEKVRVVVRRNGRPILSRLIGLRGIGGGYGTFLLVFATDRAGRFQVFVPGAAHGLGMKVVSAAIGPGSSRTAVRLLQDGLAAEHYLTSRSGAWDGATQRALLTFRKVNRLPRTYAGGRGISLALFQGRGAFRARYGGPRHAEGDLTHQVLALVNARRRVYRVLPLSSGKPSTPTVLGHFRVYLKTPGVNSEGMIDSSYFIRGYAVHGFVPVPTYPASHGCLRIPPPNAPFVFRWLTYGTPVDVYYR